MIETLVILLAIILGITIVFFISKENRKEEREEELLEAVQSIAFSLDKICVYLERIYNYERD